MAVMKTFCGCLSTRSGAMTVLLLYVVAYIAGIVYFSLQLSEDQFLVWYNAELAKDGNNCKTGDRKDAWWCNLIADTKADINTVLIVAIILCAVLLIVAIIAIIGVSKNNVWMMVPWISMKFALLVIVSVLFALTIILMSVYWPEEEDSSLVIASGIIGAAITALLFYVWLCVVSHFQILREIAKLGLASLEHVQPFHNEDGDTIFGDEDNYPTKDTMAEDYNPQEDNPASLDDQLSIQDADQDLSDAVIDDFEVAGEKIQ